MAIVKPESIQNKVALVTGGSKGIGLAIAEALLAEGTKVIICGRNQGALGVATAQLGAGAVGRQCDMGRHESVVELFEFRKAEDGGFYILINNAGVGHFGKVDELDIEEWREVIDTNLSGVFYATREAAPQMRERGGGFVINIGSLAGKYPFAGGAAYNASKFGLVGFTEAIMQDLRHDGIRVSSVMPGSVQTEFRPGGSEDAEWKLDPAQIGATVVHLLKTPGRNLASRIEMRPSRPPKK